MRKVIQHALFSAALILQGCATVEGTGRSQLMLTSPAQEAQLGADAYEQILGEEKLSTNRAAAEMVQRVGRRIANVVNRPDFAWEFKLIESDQVNAFCLPGGKIAFYTGILPILKNEAGMAAVMGHEVAHAVARHGGERMSQNILAGLGQQAVAYGTRDASSTSQQAWMTVYGASAQVGVLLPFSREHESEADELGIRYMAAAGYDPREAAEVWRRMQAASGGKRPPEFLSTHPSTDRRIRELKSLAPAAMDLYQSAPQQYGIGETIQP